MLMYEIFDLCPVLRFLVTVLNSPIILTLLGLSLGGVVASKLAFNYQRKQQIFELRVHGLKTLLDTQAIWLHAHLTSQEKESHEGWMRLLTNIRYLQVLFPGKETAEKFKSYLYAAVELSKHIGQKIDTASIEAEDDILIKLHYALNELTKVLVSRLGIPPNGST
jgi:esterase/lipase